MGREPAPHGRGRVGPAAARGPLRRGAEAAWLAAVALLSGLALAVTSRQSWFTQDDVGNLVAARRQGLSRDYLVQGDYGHFSPGHRFFNWLIWVTGPEWTLAMGLLLLCWLVAVVAFYAIVRSIAGPGFLALGATGLFAGSVVFVRTMQWFAAGGLVMPALAATLVALAAGLRWRQSRSAGMLVLALAGALVSLLFYEKAVLLLVYFVGIAWFVRAPSLRPRAILALARRDAPLVAGLALIVVAYVIVLRTGGYDAPPPHASFDDWQHYLRASWTRGTTPLLIGQSVPLQATHFNDVMIVVAQLALLALVVWSVARRFSAWRAWAFYGVAWLVNVGGVGYGRLGYFGPLVGLDLRYEQELAFLIPLALVLAFVSTEPDGSPARGLATVRRAEARVAGVLRSHAVVRYAALAALVAVWVASCANAYTRVADAWSGEASRTLTRSWLAGLDRLGAGHRPLTITGGPLPAAVSIAGGHGLADWLTVFRPDVAFDRPNGPVVVLGQDGTVRLAQDVHVVFTSPLRPRGGCYPPRSENVVRLRRPVSGPSLIMQLGLRAPSSTGVGILADRRNAGFGAAPEATNSARPGDRSVRIAIAGGPVYQLRFDVGSGRLCADRVAILSYR